MTEVLQNVESDPSIGQDTFRTPSGAAWCCVRPGRPACFGTSFEVPRHTGQRAPCEDAPREAFTHNETSEGSCEGTPAVYLRSVSMRGALPVFGLSCQQRRGDAMARSPSVAALTPLEDSVEVRQVSKLQDVPIFSEVLRRQQV